MPTNTKPRARASAKAAGVDVYPADLIRVREHIADHVLLERANELRVIELAALSGGNVHFLGPPGTGKSLGVREYGKAFGGKYFEKAMNAGMPADAIIGAYDMAHFAKTGEFVRNVEGYLPTSDVGFIDELFRANGPAQDAMLPMTNTSERQYEHNGGMLTSSILFFASASNHKPDDDNEQAQALVDRITLWLHVDRLKAKESFKELIRRNQARTRAIAAGTWEASRETITIEQMREAQRQVEQVDATLPQFLDALADLRDNVFREGISVSDRSWDELVRVMRAAAWMSGRDHCIDEDCAVAEYGIASDPDHRAAAHKLVLPFLGKFEELAVKHAAEAAAPLAEWAELKPIVADAGVNLPRELLARGVGLARGIDDVKARVDKVIATAEREQRDCTNLRTLASELFTAQKWLSDNHFPTSAFTP